MVTGKAETFRTAILIQIEVAQFTFVTKRPDHGFFAFAFVVLLSPRRTIRIAETRLDLIKFGGSSVITFGVDSERCVQSGGGERRNRN